MTRYTIVSPPSVPPTARQEAAQRMRTPTVAHPATLYSCKAREPQESRLKADRNDTERAP